MLPLEHNMILFNIFLNQNLVVAKITDLSLLLTPLEDRFLKSHNGQILTNILESG
jgi:hypothetical protein